MIPLVCLSVKEVAIDFSQKHCYIVTVHDPMETCSAFGIEGTETAKQPFMWNPALHAAR